MKNKINPLSILGDLGNITLVKKGDVYHVRKKKGPSAEKMRTAPQFARTRENWSEFARASQASKLLRTALTSEMKKMNDPECHSRLLKSTALVIKSDPTNPRGARSINCGNFQHLLGFEFNQRNRFESTCKVIRTNKTDKKAGTVRIAIPELVPANELSFPAGTTHIRFFAAAAEIDWENKTWSNDFVEGPYMEPGSQTEPAQTLDLVLAPGSAQTYVTALGIAYFQKVNGKFYKHADGTKNAMAIVDIDNS